MEFQQPARQPISPEFGGAGKSEFRRIQRPPKIIAARASFRWQAPGGYDTTSDATPFPHQEIP